MRQIVSFALLILFIPSLAFSDTLYLKNGRTVEGIIKEETPTYVDLDVGFGNIKFEKSAIEKIEKSDFNELKSLQEKWEKNKEKQGLIKSRAEEIRQEDISKWKQKNATKVQENERKPSSNPRVIDVEMVSGHMGVTVLLNNKVKASLLIDTGASVVMLTKEKGKELGLNLDKEVPDAEMQVADGRKVKAKYIILNSLKIKNIESNNIAAVVLCEDVKGAAFKDGLLGMSFLSKFNLKLDNDNQRIILDER